MKYKVVEIFDSIEGEGKRAGELCTFVRFYGCNLNCSYCDTPYGKEGGKYEEMGLDEIIGKLTYKNVTLTGGEPLIQLGIKLLVATLVGLGYYVNIETNGSKRLLDIQSDLLFYTMDFKCPSSGMMYEMRKPEFSRLTEKDVVKFVVGDRNDLNVAKDFIFEQTLGMDGATPMFYISPVFGKISPAEIVDFMKEELKFVKVRVQLQLHKFIWDPNKRGV